MKQHKKMHDKSERDTIHDVNGCLFLLLLAASFEPWQYSATKRRDMPSNALIPPSSVANCLMKKLQISQTNIQRGALQLQQLEVGFTDAYIQDQQYHRLAICLDRKNQQAACSSV